MKKIIIIIVSLLIVFCSVYFGIKIFKPYSVTEKYVCSKLQNVKYHINGYPMKFVTETNDLYILSNKLFSDGTNCKKLAEGIEFIYGNIFKGKDNNFYEIKDYEVKKKVLEDNDKLYYENLVVPGIEKYEEEHYLKDGKIYTKEHKIYNYKFDNEKILDYNFDINNDITNDVIKTDKAYYILEIVNEEECEKYVDVKCECNYVKNDFLTNKYNEISYVYGVNYETIFAIMKNGNSIEINR